MTTESLISHKSSRFGLVAGASLGAGRDDHLVVGIDGTDRNRAAIAFPMPAWPARGQLVSATLRLRTTAETHVSMGSRRHLVIRRATGAWNPNEGDEDGAGWSTDPTTWPGPPSTTVAEVTTTIPATNNTDHLIDVTALILASAPLDQVDDAGGAAWLGLALYAEDEADDVDTVEVYSHRASVARRPELEVETIEAAAPDAPVPLQPIGADGYPSFLARYSHPLGLEVDAYDLEVVKWTAGGVEFGWSTIEGTAGINTGANTITASDPLGSLIHHGPEYAWRMRVRDTDGTWSAWSVYSVFIRSQTVATPDPYDRWASRILSELARPPALTALGTLRPDGPDEVLPVVCAEYGHRWQVVHDHTDPPIDRVVRVLGMRVKLTPEGVEVDATTEDVEA